MGSSTTPPPAWLDDITGTEALDWARRHNEATLDSFDATSEKPRSLAHLRSRILAALDTDDRIPYPRRRGDYLYNFWRDSAHPRGLWRRTTTESYLADPDRPADWEVLIDVDALAADEAENWVWKGAQVRYPAYDRALIRLSRGGADATCVREFDLATGRFLTPQEGGFQLDEAKTDVSWVDLDHILVGTDIGPGSLTHSGYPCQVRRWTRGTRLAESELIFSGEPEDVAVGGWHDATEGFERTFVERALDFYRARRYLVTPEGLTLIDLPEDCEFTVHRQWLLLLPRTEYLDIPAGGLAAISFDDFLAGGRDLRLLFTPDSHTSLQSMAWTHDHLVLTLLRDVATELLVFTAGSWTSQSLPSLPAPATTSVIGTSPTRDNEVWLTSSGFTEPATLLRGDVGTTDPTPVRRAPALFATDGLTTRQHFAQSADGTAIPYFITGRLDGTPRPTLVHAYGGFEVSLVPGYSATRGIGWLELGGTLVEANLRGGGEYGPEWHSSVTGAERVRVYQDHRAVLEDVVARGYATGDGLGIRGGSNGGLLTAVALTSYPELFGAAIIQVPLADMLRYHQLSAGASWMAEYGNPDDADLRPVLASYSPVHNVVPRSTRPYPPALVTTSTRDDRVHPTHARTLTWQLEAAGQPVDYYENIEGGHGGAADNAQSALVEALIHAWLWRKIGQGDLR